MAGGKLLESFLRSCIEIDVWISEEVTGTTLHLWSPEALDFKERPRWSPAWLLGESWQSSLLPEFGDPHCYWDEEELCLWCFSKARAEGNNEHYNPREMLDLISSVEGGQGEVWFKLLDSSVTTVSELLLSIILQSPWGLSRRCPRQPAHLKEANTGNEWTGTHTGLSTCHSQKISSFVIWVTAPPLGWLGTWQWQHGKYSGCHLCPGRMEVPRVTRHFLRLDSRTLTIQWSRHIFS